MSGKAFVCVAGCLALIATATAQVANDRSGAPATSFISKDNPGKAGDVSRTDEAAYRGLRIADNSDAIGDAVELKGWLGELLALQDFVPFEREAHFRWIDNMETSLTGWQGKIISLIMVEGGVEVAMQVHPELHNGGVAAVDDHVTEHYFFDGNRFQYLELEERKQDGPRVITIN